MARHDRPGRPRGSVKSMPAISVSPHQVARECWDEARAAVVDGREVFETFRESFDAMQISGPADVLIPMMRLVDAMLAVDMAIPENRKGALPAALGLVSRSDATRDHAIAWAFDRIQAADATTDGFLLTDSQAATLVAEAFNAEGITRDLTAGAVRRIVERVGAAE